MSKKFLLISYNYYPELTGIGKYNTELCEYLRNKGNTVKVITGFPYYPNWKLFEGYANRWYKKEVINGVSLVRCPIYIPAIPNGTRRMMQDFSFYLSSLLIVWYQVFTCKKYDIIITPSPSFMSGFHGILLKFFWRKSTFVYHIQDLQIDAAIELGMIKKGWQKKILLGMEHFILNHATVVSTISEGMRKRIEEKSENLERVIIFPNWVDSAVIFKQQPDLQVIEELGIPLDKKIFFYSGSIGAKQGLEILIDIAPELAIACPGLLFVISGSGPYMQKLVNSIEERKVKNILFIELQPSEIFIHLLNYAHCHLIIQKKQTSDLLLPSKLTNILAVGGLCIVTAEPDSTLFDVVYYNKIGIVVPPEDKVALTESITRIYRQL